MRSYHYVPLIFITLSLFPKCNMPGNIKTNPGHFSPDNLPSFLVDVDITKDTVLRAPGGSLIHIPAGTLEAEGDSHVKLVIREALCMSDIIRAGLVTIASDETSNIRQMLSSGGMIDIEVATGQAVRITKAIGISIPASYIDKQMQLYQGSPDKRGNMNWIDPQPLAPNPQFATLDTGKRLFEYNCSPCHAINRPIVGPALAYISRLREKKWLYAYTRNNEAVKRSGDRYAICLYSHGNISMPVFENLTDHELDQLYTYIGNESIRMHLKVPDDNIKKCVDSCSLYHHLKDSLLKAREKLVRGNGQRVTEEIKMPAGYISGDTGKIISKVRPPAYQAVYYQFNIKTFGWYNIDISQQNTEGVKESELIVRLQGAYSQESNIYLVIPSAKVFAEGGPLDAHENEYGFYTGDGRLPLINGVKAFILAMGEKEEKPVFAMTSFITTEKQTLDIEPKTISPEAMNAELRSLDFQGIDMEVKDTKGADALRETTRELEEVEHLKPRNCDCNCGLITDSTATNEPQSGRK